MIKNILFAGLLLLTLSGLGSATITHNYYYSTDGTGVFVETSYLGTSCGSGENIELMYQNNGGQTLYWQVYNRFPCIFGSVLVKSNGAYLCGALSANNSLCKGSGSISSGHNRYFQFVGGASPKTCKGNIILYIAHTPIVWHNISGQAGCLDEVELYLYNGSQYNLIDHTTNDPYTFDVINESTYKIVFLPDSHTYIFTVNGTNITYNYDTCAHTTYRFEESCGNLIPNSEGYYCEYTDGGISCNWFEESDGILDISNSSANKIEIYTDTFIGQTKWIIDPVVSNTTYTPKNLNIAWGLKVIVQNGSSGSLIDGAMVKVDQDCYCTSGYSTRQKLTVNGMTSFSDMSLQDASLWVMKTGYKVLDENSTGYSTFLSGRSNFSSKTWIVKLAPNGDANESEWFEPQNKVDIHFRNEDGNQTSKILDTDTEVYLYYENNNSEEEAMTLKFQSSSTHTYFSDEQSWTIAYDDIGHKTIANSYFTPWNYAYRAIIYNSSIYGWNLTIPLTVRNGTKEDNQHYENLTTNLWFMHEEDGKIDYREDMEIVSHAGSNNTTLMNIDLELWKDGALLCYKNLTASDYIGADFPYYYVYEPVYDYVSGSNYTAKMYGFDRTLLEVRYLECITDDTTRKNKLTIAVKDRAGANLDNCYIYLEDWGSLPTGSTYYNAYEGIDNGYYRYKASKSGYSGTGWADVTLSDNDEIVWYTLIEDYTNTTATQQKLTDDDIKGIFFPLMFFLLIVIVFGGFKYVSS